MRISRRAVIASSLLPFAAAAQAPEWPSRPVRFIVPYPPGGPTDIMGRIVAQAVQGPLGQPFVVENRAGANGLIGSEQAARAVPDGGTFLVNASAHVIVPHLTPNMPIDVLADFAPVTNIAAVPLWLVVNPALPVRSVAEFIAYARANPGKLNMATGGTGSGQHVAAVMLRRLGNIQMVEIPYKGAQAAYTDLVGGRVDLFFDNTTTAQPLIEAGRIKAIATSGSQRDKSLAAVPTAIEAGLAGMVLESWLGIFAPARTPPAAVSRLREAMTRVVAQPDLRKRLEDGGWRMLDQDAASTEQFVRAEAERWPTFLREAGISGE